MSQEKEDGEEKQPRRSQRLRQKPSRLRDDEAPARQTTPSTNLGEANSSRPSSAGSTASSGSENVRRKTTARRREPTQAVVATTVEKTKPTPLVTIPEEDENNDVEGSGSPRIVAIDLNKLKRIPVQSGRASSVSSTSSMEQAKVVTASRSRRKKQPETPLPNTLALQHGIIAGGSRDSTTQSNSDADSSTNDIRNDYGFSNDSPTKSSSAKSTPNNSPAQTAPKRRGAASAPSSAASSGTANEVWVGGGSDRGPYADLPDYGNGRQKVVPPNYSQRSVVKAGVPYGKKKILLRKIIEVNDMSTKLRSHRGFKIGVRFAEDPEHQYFVQHDELHEFVNGEKEGQAYLNRIANSCVPEDVRIWLGLIEYTSKARPFCVLLKNLKEHELMNSED